MGYGKGNRLLPAVSVLLGLLFAGCIGEAPTVNPEAITQSVAGTPTGILVPQCVDSYPADLDGSIPLDADIVLVFSKPINTATITDTNVLIDAGVVSFVAGDVSSVSGGLTIIINVPAWTAGAHTIQLTTSIQDTTGQSLNLGVISTINFTAVALADETPRVISSALYPANGATGVGVNLPYVEVTFTRDMNAGTITTGSYTIFPATGANSVTSTGLKTYQLNLTTLPLTYNTSYTVSLDALTITDSIGNLLVDDDGTADGFYRWSFTTETDPDTGPALAISSVWVESVTNNSATVAFTTNRPVAENRSYALWDTVAGITADNNEVQESISTAETDLHTINIAGLSPSTLYYFRGGVDITAIANGMASADGDLISAADVAFITDSDGLVDTALTTAANDQTGLRVIQNSNGTAFALWVSGQAGNDDIYGQFFDATGVAQWGVNGAAVAGHGNNQSGIEALSNGFSDAVLVYRDVTVGDDLYAKMVFNNAGAAGFRWGGAAAAQGVALGITIKAGSTYSTALAHEWPAPVSSGTADMPANGAAANLLYDKDTDFSVLGLAANDLLVWGGGPWNPDTVFAADSWGVFRFVIRSTGATGLAAESYYLADQVAVASGTVDLVIPATTFQANDINLPLVNVNDVIDCNGTWAIVTNITNPAAGVYEITTDVNHNLALNDPFDVYPRIAGPLTSQAVTSPLWDQAPAILFNPGVTVLVDDVVVNENNNTVAATWARVTGPINLSVDTDYALRLTSDIMNNADVYSIIRLPMTPTGTEVAGYSPAAAPANFTLTDFTGLNYAGAGVVNGDIVYNIDGTLSAMVTNVAVGTLSLSADVFNATLEKYIIFRYRGFLVAFIDNSDFVRARAFNIADGSPLGASFSVCTNGTNSNPVAVADGAGDVMIFYQNGVNIYWKKVSADGAFLWGGAASTAAGIGLGGIAGYSIVQVLPAIVTGGADNAFLLAKNNAGSIRIIYVSGATGAVLWNNAVSATGYDPYMAVDTVAGPADRVIVTYRDNTGHVPAAYYHIRVVAYNAAGATAVPGFAAINVSSTTVSYDCRLPQVLVADTAAGTSEFYIAWYDGRYYGTVGYSLFAQRFNATGVAQWASSVFVSTPTSFTPAELVLNTLYYDDGGGAPFGLMPLWLDYRGADVDIFLDYIDQNGL